MFFSVVIPVYNVENYLLDCVKSVTNQDFIDGNYEIVLVNDGSTDSSGSICEGLKKEFNNIKVIHKKNGGLSDARNVGVSSASGEYIFFLDSDDKMTLGALAKCKELLSEYEDILICNQYRLVNGRREITEFPNTVYSSRSIEDLINIFIKSDLSIPWAAYQSIFKRQIIVENKIYFTKGLIGAEDCDFFFRYIDLVDTYKISSFPIVEYLVARPDSIMTNVKKDAVIGRLSTFSSIFYKKEHNLLQKQYFAKKYFNVGLDICKLQSSLDIAYCKKVFFSEMVILDEATEESALYKTINFIWILFGIVNGSKIINFIRKK